MFVKLAWIKTGEGYRGVCQLNATDVSIKIDRLCLRPSYIVSSQIFLIDFRRFFPLFVFFLLVIFSI